jgi:hypothetical protein
MPKFQTRTYTESIEYVGKLATLPDSNIDSEVALIAYLFKQDLFKVGKDVIRFAKKWNKLINKPI